MPNWNEILNEVKAGGSIQDVTRRKYLRKLNRITKRNVVVYYSGWLQKGSLQNQGINLNLSEDDKNGFMTAIHKLDRSKGLDLILHTPGGSASATESLVGYLRSMFPGDIRAIVPQIAMSAGTMIALACKEVVMGKHSSLGPIDPQIMGIPAHGILEEFEQAKKEVTANPGSIPIWQPIIAKYNPTLIGECQKAMEWSKEIVKEWLETGMFNGDPEAGEKADRVVNELSDHSLTKSHSRQIPLEKIQDLGINVMPLENDQKLQEAVLSVHHACILTLSETPAFKIIENHLGIAYIMQARPTLIAHQ